MAKMTLSVAVVMMLLICIAPFSSAEEEEISSELLVDYGNGNCDWYPIDGGSTLKQAISSTLSENGIAAEYSETDGCVSVESINGQGKSVIGDVVCIWRVYTWNGVSWEFLSDDLSERYAGGPLALGFYPNETTVPVSSPVNKEVWTSYRGDSSSSGTSSYKGPSKAVTPLEWYNTYSGSVDSNILSADGLIYHTVSGRYGSVGMDSLARLYCLDPVNREVAWTVNFSNSGSTEITTPLIIGDMIVIPSGNWHVYCLDRISGEPLFEMSPDDRPGDMCVGSKVCSYTTYRNDPSVSKDRIHNNAGVTNCVYDSGCIFMCLADGTVRCVSLDRDTGFRVVWTSIPDDDVRGCFYYYPPTVADTEFGKTILCGNYSGCLMALDADDGSVIWSKKIQCNSGDDADQIASVQVCSGDRALVSYSHSETSSTTGGMLLLNISDGSVIWKKDLYCSRPVVYGDRFYGYVSYSLTGEQFIRDSQSGTDVEVVSGYYSFWLKDCSLCWVQDSDSLCVGGQTYSDGRLYSIDYSPGTEGAFGGWVWCIDSDTGTVVWKVKVSPYSGTAYCMSAPTVVNGKVLVGNDYGAVYVISEIPYETHTRSSNIDYSPDGLSHWSWWALGGLSIAVLAAAIVCYRK